MTATARRAMCWSIVRRDGTVILGTSLDRDLAVTAAGYEGTYASSLGLSASSLRGNSDLSVDNMEVNGLQADMLVSAADIEAGLFDNAQVVIFQTSWADPSSVKVLRRGVLGQITRTREGAYTAEVRGFSQLLSQNTVNVYQATCRATLGSGDEVPVIQRCGVDLSAFRVSGTITALATADRSFTASALTQAAGYFQRGVVTFTSGDNEGFAREIKRHQAGGVFDLVEPLPYDLQVGDTFTVTPGCDHVYQRADGSYGDCKTKFDNLVNFRGDPLIPGLDAIVQVGTQ
ncbi:MAG TPA: DUF2163 domain-containing protein [Nevskiaceae bacterium]|nr:DUF2163 domain-containing protein [Nevskiaceae bacterium]